MALDTIKLAFRGTPGVEIEGTTFFEPVLPGMLVWRSGESNFLPYPAVYVGRRPLITWVAVENPYGLSEYEEEDLDGYSQKQIDIQYEVGSKIYLIAPRRGDTMYMQMKTGESASAGDFMEPSDEAGTLQSDAVDFSNAIGMALEDAPAGGRVKVEIS